MFVSCTPFGHNSCHKNNKKTREHREDEEVPLDAKIIPGYVLKKKLGAGAMAAVFLATEEKLQRDVALKVMLPKLAKDAEFVDRFLREARIAAAFAHQNIVRVFDVGSHNTYHYMAMELLPGGDLSSRLRQGVPLEEALGYIKDIAEGLGYAASKNCIHRDIKPDNIMFAEDGRAVITDFGIARNTAAEVNMTIAGSVIGTPQYMSPEQANGEELDFRSDLYSLGIIVYEILAGIPPFKADSAISTALMHVTQPVPKLPAKYAQFQGFVNKALAKKPNERFQSAGAFIEALLDINFEIPEDDGSETLVIGADAMQQAREELASTAKMPKAAVRKFDAESLSLIEEDTDNKHTRDSRYFSDASAFQQDKAARRIPLPGIKTLAAVGILLCLIFGHIYYVNILEKTIHFDVMAARLSHSIDELTGKKFDFSGAAKSLSSASVGFSSLVQTAVGTSTVQDSKQKQFLFLFDQALGQGRLYEPRLDCAQLYLNELLHLEADATLIEKKAAELSNVALDKVNALAEAGNLEGATHLLQQTNETMLYVQDKRVQQRHALTSQLLQLMP